MRILKGIVLLVFICVFIRIVIGEPCVVPSGSMEPTLLCGDRLWINKLAYGGRLPKRWADIPLNDRGRELARITGEALREVPFDLIISSPSCSIVRRMNVYG